MMRYRHTLLFAALETRRADGYQNASRSCYWNCYWGYTGQLSANFFSVSSESDKEINCNNRGRGSYWLSRTKTREFQRLLQSGSQQRVLLSHDNIAAVHTSLLQVYRCCYNKGIHVVMIIFAEVLKQSHKSLRK